MCSKQHKIIVKLLFSGHLNEIIFSQVMCGKQHMEVEVTFDKPFNGIIFSKVNML